MGIRLYSPRIHIPDLDSPQSFRGGVESLGVSQNQDDHFLWVHMGLKDVMNVPR